MESGLLTFAYLTASVLFILSLRGLSSQETARQGNVYGMLGMLVAGFALRAASDAVAAQEAAEHQVHLLREALAAAEADDAAGVGPQQGGQRRVGRNEQASAGEFG